jgi:hypothetical protein
LVHIYEFCEVLGSAFGQHSDNGRFARCGRLQQIAHGTNATTAAPASGRCSVYFLYRGHFALNHQR